MAEKIKMGDQCQAVLVSEESEKYAVPTDKTCPHDREGGRSKVKSTTNTKTGFRVLSSYKQDTTAQPTLLVEQSHPYTLSNPNFQAAQSY